MVFPGVSSGETELMVVSARKSTLVQLVLAIFAVAFFISFLSAYIRHEEASIFCSSIMQCYLPSSMIELSAGDVERLNALATAKNIHRLTATLTIVLALVISGYVVKEKRLTPDLKRLIVALFVVLIFLAVIGPLSSRKQIPIVAVGNYLGGIILTGVCWWFFLKIRQVKRAIPVSLGSNLWIACWFLALQLLLGIWVSANYATHACDSMTSCGAIDWSWRNILLALDFTRELSLDGQGMVSIGGVEKIIHILHKITALFTAMVLIVLGARIKQRLGLWLLLLIFVQLVAGVSNVIFEMPVIFVLFHNLLAALVFLTLLTAIYYYREEKNEYTEYKI